MCPEYERHLREENAQVSILEMDVNAKQTDEYSMVKEYRRSGADQDEPLPHELRSPQVLMRTMDYLICNIVDRLETESISVAEWYDFLWNRTRAIRKDIIQQHLCEPLTVSILEKCARFHIHCSEALCEEPAAVFDVKINTQNLNQCIQSLKDSYDDLALKGVPTPNEAEFRCYYLLMNLTDSDILREVKHYKRHIKDSVHVKFALKVYYALSANNYVKFFQLVRQATYLCGCLLHRYFKQVRLTAIKIMKRAYTVGTQIEQQYPLQLMGRQLGFDFLDNLTVYCRSMGLLVLEDHVLLKRAKPIDIDAIPISRSSLIEKKRDNWTLSQVINGEPLPDNPYRKFPLQDSFDDNGRFIKDSSIFSGQRIKLNFSFGTQEPVDAKKVSIIPKKPEISEEDRERIENSLASQIIGECIASLVKKAAIESVVTISAREACSGILHEAIGDLIESIVKKLIQCEREESLRMKKRALLAACKQMGESVIARSVQDLVKKESLHVYHNLMEQLVRVLSARVSYELMEQCVNEVIISLVIQVYRDAIAERDRLVACMRKKRAERLSREYLLKWRVRCGKIKRFKKIRASFPAANTLAWSPQSIVCANIVSPVENLLLDSETENQSGNIRRLSVRDYDNKPFVLRKSNSSGEISNLKRKLEEEKHLNESFRKRINIFRSSLTLDDLENCENED